MKNKETLSTRPAWVEIDLSKLRQNFKIIFADKPKNLHILSVIKDQAYGHGAVEVAKVAINSGVSYLGVVTLDEALEVRENFITAPVLVFGERTREQFPIFLQQNLTCCINDMEAAEALSALALQKGVCVPFHVEIDTGMSRFGFRWNEALMVIQKMVQLKGIFLEGIMSHFAMSDEADKSFAKLQLQRFNQVLNGLSKKNISVKYRHMCNTGGFLDLPDAYFDMVRIGILPFGVYPSKVCRRISGLQPVMTVKAKIVTIRNLLPGDKVGYGMRYTASSKRRIAVIPLGYGDGFPRVRNTGEVLIHGKRVPIIGGNAMDAMMVDITNIPEAGLWDEVVVMGKQGDEEISVHEIAQLKNSVSYDILTGWRWRLPRIYIR